MTAEFLGKLQGASAYLRPVFVDGASARQWPGWAGNSDGRNRTLLANWADEEVGTVAEVGSAGLADIWQVGDDIVLLDFFPDADFDDDSRAGRQQLAQRVEGLPTRGAPRSNGFVNVKSGCLAIMLEYADASGVTKALRSGARKLTSFDDHGVLIPLENGRYQIFTENLGRNADGHSDDIGTCVSRTRIVRAASSKRAPAKPKANSKPLVDVFAEHGVWWGWARVNEPFDFVALDAADAPRYDGDGDFERSFKLAGNRRGGGAFTTASGAQGVVGTLGLGLAITYWQLPAGVGLLDLDHDPKKLDLSSKSGREMLGAYFAQLPAVKSTLLGMVTVRSGALCVMGTLAHPKKSPRVGANKPTTLKQGQFEVGAAFPVENGVYEVHRDLLGEPKRGALTEVGRVHVRVRYERVPTRKRHSS